MSFITSKITRIPTRIAHDAKIIRLVSNWREFLRAKLSGKHISRLELRNGIILDTPKEMDLNFLFHEIWLDEIYGHSGYEIKGGDIVVDIGGNIGVFAAYAATRSSNVSVYSFEPFPENAKFYLSNMKESGLQNATLQNLAVAGDSGTRTLHVANSWGSHSLNRDAESGGLKVQCTTLNDIISRVKRCDYLKVDCEGGEYEIFSAASEETLRAIGKIVCEYHNNEQGTGEALQEFLKENKFRVDRAEEIDEHTGMIYAKNLSFAPGT